MKISRLFLAVIACLPLCASAAAFTSTADGKAMEIPDATFDTPAAKEFLKSGKNPYVGNIAAIKAGKKVYQLYSCSQCHGPEAKGQVGPGLTGPNFRYPKDAEDKGMFETIWGGSAGGMGAKGKGLMQPDDPTAGLTPDEVLKVESFLRAGGKVPESDAAKPAEAKPVETAVAATAAAPVAAATTTDATADKSKHKQKRKRKGQHS